MTRSISFILCLVVVLFLIPVQVESEYELETEMICCALCYSYSRPESRSAEETVGWKPKGLSECSDLLLNSLYVRKLKCRLQEFFIVCYVNKRYGCDFILIINGSVLHFRQFKLIYKQMTLIFFISFRSTCSIVSVLRP